MADQVRLGDRVAQTAPRGFLPFLPGGHRGVELIGSVGHLVTIAHTNPKRLHLLGSSTYGNNSPGTAIRPSCAPSRELPSPRSTPPRRSPGAARGAPPRYRVPTATGPEAASTMATAA